MSKISDDAFLKFAEEQEQEAKNEGFGSNQPREYEDIKWTGLEPNKVKIVRAVGGPPNSNAGPDTARTVRVSSIKGDNGKKFKCIFPDHGEDPSHILWRIMGRVNAVEWINGEKQYIYENKFPELFNIVNKNGLTKDDRQHRFERGWRGRNVIIMNVIDREQMEWHKENKKTMLLSRNIGTSADGREFPEDGVPSYGFIDALARLFKYYKSWERYDIGITRTGKMQSPYHVINAGVNIVEVPDNLQGIVSKEVLTEEEASWERYDIGKIYGYTSATKIYNRLKATIARIDAAFNTKFLDELKAQSDKERAEWEKNPTTKNVVEEKAPKEEVETVAEPVEEKPATRERKPAENEGPQFDVSLLKGWDNLSQKEKDVIKNVTKKGNTVEITYDGDHALLGCPDCQVPSPDWLESCPACGLSYA